MPRSQLAAALAALAALLLGCGAGAPPPVATESEPTPPEESSGRWTDFYGAGGEPDYTEVEREVLSQLSVLGGPGCSHDSRLIRAARDHAGALASAPLVPAGDDLDRIRFVLHREGATDYQIQPLVARTDPEGVSSLIRLVAEHRGSWTHCGVGISGTGAEGRVVWIGARRVVEIDLLPVAVEPGSHIGLTGRVNVASSAPVQPFLGLPDGSVTRLPVAQQIGSDEFRARVRFGGPGRYELELLVDSGRGPETVVLVPIFVGISPDPRPVVAPATGDDHGVDQADEVLQSFLDTVRSRRNLATLERDSRLDEVARAHSEEMSRVGFFGHVSPSRGTLADRLDSRGLAPTRSAENVARSDNLLRIHRNLMGSPSHRIHSLDPSFTHVGIGVARDGADYIVTEIFARW